MKYNIFLVCLLFAWSYLMVAGYDQSNWHAYSLEKRPVFNTFLIYHLGTQYVTVLVLKMSKWSG